MHLMRLEYCGENIIFFSHSIHQVKLTFHKVSAHAEIFATFITSKDDGYELQLMKLQILCLVK